MPQSGKAIQAAVLAYCASRDDIAAYNIVAASVRGVPDVLACVRGRFVAVEVKGRGDTLKPIQAAQIERIKAAGGRAFVVESVQEFKEIINEV